jgi:hypothetical protein
LIVLLKLEMKIWQVIQHAYQNARFIWNTHSNQNITDTLIVCWFLSFQQQNIT